MNEMINKYREEIINIILKQYDEEGVKDTKIPSLYFYKTSSLSEFTSIVYEPSICLALQGSKEIEFGNKFYNYDEKKYLLSSTNIPAKVRIEKASIQNPYISLKITFSLEEIYDVLKEIENTDTKKRTKMKKGLFFDQLNTDLLNPILRLLKLLNTSDNNIKFMAPLIKKEILYILINGESGDFLKEYVKEGTITNQIVKVISEIKNNFNETLNMKEIAYKFDLSESSLYHNFKKVTMHSPLQFQKKLRLEEAKHILLTQNIDASEVAFLVGYESPSQFSREYSRMYGLPPKTHIKQLHGQNLE